MATEYDPNERIPKANPTRWLPWLLAIVGAVLIFFVVRGVRNPGGGGGGRTSDSMRSESEATTTTSDVPAQSDSVASDTKGASGTRP